MKQKMSQEQIQLTAINALQLPALKSPHADLNEVSLREFHAPLAATMTHVRELGSALLIVRMWSTDQSDGLEKRINDFFNALLEPLKLPGEKINFEVKTGAKTGLIIINLFKETA